MTGSSYECTVNGDTENGQRRKNRKEHSRGKISEWGGEKSHWRWRMEAVKDIYWAICYYRRRGETNSFFLFLALQKDMHQFPGRGVTGPLCFFFTGWVVKVCSSLLRFIHHKKKEDISPGASWVILRGRKRGSGERMAAGPFVIYCSLSPFAPRHPQNLWGQSLGLLRSTGALPDGCTRSRERRDGARGRQEESGDEGVRRSERLTIPITVNRTARCA